MKKNIFGLLVLVSGGVFGNTPPSIELPIKQFNSLQISIHKFLTDSNGLFLPEQFLEVSVGERVRIYKTDKTYYDGRITDIVKDSTSYKIYGNVYSKADCSFSIMVNTKGDVYGMLLDKKDKKVYTLEFSQNLKGYIFIENFQSEQQLKIFQERTK
jgi:hypothetical protein